ncbi:cell division ATP-binding protein FtsE [Leucobacter sp. M11]|uniref:cell division ATP-binding protein FtsE n=1 Tax=Leucobacter sp. M11 TaxID=2993565 RepID=UPI002D80CAA8|nr:cell division ATP-binding protein FtsE [Leucobacter sp. M11]MEB4613861.1 cell division ATP-binding protein FtsE [Leucobacter sp. M11]
MIWFDEVTKQYRGTQKPALDRINLRIERGEFVFIVGASGSGKSSCLQLILREEQPTSGSIHVLGHNLSTISSRKVPYFRRNLGVVFQDFRLLTNKTVYDNVAFSLQVIGKSRGFIQEAVPDTLEMVGLGGKGKRFPHELSGGEQQRVAIARAIVNKPSILLADEPTGNLDPNTSLGIMQLLQAIKNAGTTVVMATHEAGFVDVMQQRVVELSQGVIVRDELEGGYGATASIPVTVDMATQIAPPLRPSEEIIAAALAPREDEDDETPAGPRLGESTAEPITQSLQRIGARPEPTPVAPTPARADAAPEPAEGAPAESEPAAGDADSAAATAEDAAADAPLTKPAPPGSPDRADPLALSETGSLAESLGLSRDHQRLDDEQTDVGPVR